MPSKKTTVDGVPALRTEVDGKPVIFVLGQIKLNILERFGAVFLGPEFEDSHQVRVVIEGRPKTMYGYTQDPQIVKMVQNFLNENARLAIAN